MLLPEFQAVILAAGKGSRMPELTAGKPKCLLPVGSKPLVWYPLQKLQELGFNDAIMIVMENQKAEIQTVLDKTNLSIKIDYFCIADEDLGTADSLRLICDKIKSDVLVLSCDLVTDANLTDFINLFRKHDASVCALLFHPPAETHLLIPGSKSKHKHERDLIGIDSQTDRLIFLASASDFETDVTLPKLLVKKHTNIMMYSNLIDSHVYILKKWTIKYLLHEKQISTLKGELLPHIIKKQFIKPKAKEPNLSMVNPRDSNDIFHYAGEYELDSAAIRGASTYNDHFGDLKPSYNDDIIQCFAYVAKPNVFGIRVNTLSAYCLLNNKIIEKWGMITNGEQLQKIHPKTDVKSTQVDQSTIVWESSRLNEKTSYKNSIIGYNCEIQNFSRIFNTVLMSNVVVKEKVALENCIVCDGVVIESGSQLKNCLIGSNHTITEQSIHSNEVLTVTDRLMEF